MANTEKEEPDMTDSLNRRQFVKGATTAAAAGYVVKTGVALAQDAPRSRVRVGVMGLSRGKSLALTFGGRSGVEVACYNNHPLPFGLFIPNCTDQIDIKLFFLFTGP